VLRVSEAPAPAAAAGQVAVAIEAIGVNYAEVLSRKGLYGWAPPLPYVLGMEACGRIEAVGAGVDERRVGERVIIGAQTGCYAERAVVPAAQAMPALAGYSLAENAAFAVNYMTAWVGLMEMARLRAGDRVLITAAAGGVGTAAVQLAKAFGCSVYGAAGSEAKLATLRDLGVDAAISYGEPGFADRVRAAVGAASSATSTGTTSTGAVSTGSAGTGAAGTATASSGAAGDGVANTEPRRCIDVALEVVGGQVFRDSMGLLAPFGRIVVAGFAGYELRWWKPLSWWRTWRDMPRADVARLAVASRGVLATHIGYLLKDPELMSRLWNELTTFVADHSIRPVVGATFALDEIAEAHRLMESRRSTGKIVVRV
jgi:NADPH2:quinone reductase